MNDFAKTTSEPVELNGLHCSMKISRLSEDLVVITITGYDIGEFDETPFRELETDIVSGRKIELFIDSREAKGASIDVSNDWALWFNKHLCSFHQITMLTGSRFIHVTANFVRYFSQLEGIMRLTTDSKAFDDALNDALHARIRHDTSNNETI